MNIRFLETVIWLAHYRNFRLTGEHLHITQAAISSRISVIEQELGVRLFERQTREVVVTPAGEAFVAEAREIVRRYEAMVNRHRAPVAMGGLVRLGLPSSMAHLLLPEITRTLRDRHPSVRLEVITDDTADKLVTLLPGKRIDVCLTAHPPPAHANLQVRPLCSLAMAWCAAPPSLPSADDVYSVRDLSRQPIITYAPGSLNAVRMRDFFGPLYSEIPHLITSNSLATSLQMAVSGVGVAVLPLALVQRELAEGVLRVIRTQAPFPATAYSAVWFADKDAGNAEGIAQLAQAAASRLAQQFAPDVVQVPLMD